jgi:hypothetical protein
LEYWQKIAEDPKLLPAAAQAARNQVRTYRAAVWCFEKAFACHERNRQEYLEHQATGWRRGVDWLLIEIPINAARFERLYGAEQVNQRAAKPVNR